MFGSKKQAGSKSPWSLQILTTQYLIEGTFHWENFKVGGEDLFARSTVENDGVRAFERMRLCDARIQPTGNLQTPVLSVAEWEWLALDAVVAIIPRDDASLQAAQKAYKDYRHPLDTVVCAGPYILRGKLLSDDADRSRSPFAMTQLVPLTDVQINCQLPGAKLTGMQVPWLLLNGTGGSPHGFGFPV